MPDAATGTTLRYDRITILLHWLTAALVITLFALAEGWGFLPRGAGRKSWQSLHISLGICLAVVVLLRVAWRITRGRHLPAADTGLQGLAAKAMHYALYGLLLGQIVLGFVYRWAQAEPFMFFGLVPMRLATVRNAPLAHQIGAVHEKIAWIIIILAALHATAALLHHYVWRDGVLKRMLIGRAG